MKKLVLLLAFVIVVPSSLCGQSLSDAQCNTVKAIDAKFPALNKGSDDQRREFALKVAQQFVFSFPGEGWGSKDAGGGRPQTKDVVARLRNGILDGWELVDGGSRGIKCNDHIPLDGQHFIEVSPVNYLGSEPPPQPTGDFVTHAELDQLHALVDELAARVAKLSATGGGTPVPADTTAAEQLAVTKKIFELLQKTAARFGVQ